MKDAKKIYFLEPVFEAKYWGGQAIRERYGYETELPNIALVYHVIALPQHQLDNKVLGTDKVLSKFYHENPELFHCDREEFPIRLSEGNGVDLISIQLHPNDEYCLAHEGERGKVECLIRIQGDCDHLAIRGHHAKTKEEFCKLVKEERWDQLFRIVEIKKGQYTHTPQGLLHGEPKKTEEKDIISLAFETNSDITYRLYDHDRNMADRPLHIDKIIDTVNIPDDTNYGIDVVPRNENGCIIYDFLDEPGIFTAKRIQVKEEGIYEQTEFLFLVCLDGEAKINDIHIKKGETVFIPYNYGPLHVQGDVDLGLITYKNRI
ncbi:hypothetical protein [[Eubacterium] hominis]|uniref:hypothetical protein n=1 Tax=[Eubacterium] hominis TaxID=2764325 RepID=UPI003A4D5574